jgi:RHS repeat-associated protein
MLTFGNSRWAGFITQSQSFDPWSNVNAGSEYSIVGVNTDRFLVSGREQDTETGNVLLDWRNYDSVLGRMNSYDPEDPSVMLSGYAYAGNNPVSVVDPDGRNPAAIGAVVGAIGYTLGVAFSKGGFKNWNWMSFATATISGAVMGGISNGIGGAAKALREAHKTGAAFALQTGGHALSGGFNSALNGGSFGGGMLSGATGSVWGGLTEGLGAVGQIGGSAVFSGLASELSGGDFWQGATQGAIIAGLNHALHQIGSDKIGYGKFVDNEKDGVNFIWKMAKQFKKEHELFYLSEGKFFIPEIKGLGAPDNTDDSGYGLARYKVKNGKVIINNKIYKLRAHLHTHQDAVLANFISSYDANASKNYGVPIYIINENNTIGGYNYNKYYNSGYSFGFQKIPQNYTRSALLNGYVSILNLRELLKTTYFTPASLFRLGLVV